MKYSELASISKKNMRKNGVVSYVIFAFLMLMGASFLLLCIFLDTLYLAIVPLIVIPVIFACFVSVIALREQDPLTFRAFLRGFGSYYTSKFNSTFRVFKSALLSFLVYIIFSLVYGLILNLCLYYNNAFDYQAVAADIIAHINVSYSDLQIIFNNHREFINILMIYYRLPCLFVFSISFTFLICFYSPSLFYRLDTPQLPGQLNKIVHGLVIKNNRKEYVSTFLKLNWPMFVILLGGFALGAVIGYYTIGTSFSMFAFGMAIGFFTSFGFYGPHLLANNETIYTVFKSKYGQEEDRLKNEYTKTIQQLLDEFNDTKKDSDES